jgi:hypothetical protein
LLRSHDVLIYKTVLAQDHISLAPISCYFVILPFNFATLVFWDSSLSFFGVGRLTDVFSRRIIYNFDLLWWQSEISYTKRYRTKPPKAPGCGKMKF